MTRAEADRLVRDALERYKKGEVDAAARVYAEVLAALPDHPMALHYMALVEQHHGRTTEAVELLRRSIRIDSKDPRAYNHLGQIVLGQNQIQEAIACFRRAIEVDPGHTESINNLANVLALNGQRTGAIELYRRAFALNPRAINSIYNLANALKDEGAHDEARHYFELAVQVMPSHVRSHHDLGVLLEQKGRFAEAISHYETAQRLQPDHVKSLSSLLAMPAYEPGEGTVQDAERRLIATGLAEDDRMRLHHGLGLYYDRAQRYAEAFVHFRAAKDAMRRRSGPFEARALAEYVSRSIAKFPAEYFRALPGGGSPSHRPVFIVGMPRSGTTLCEQILARHPLVFPAGERQEISEIARTLSPAYPERVTRLKAGEIAGYAKRYLAAIDELAPPVATRVTDKLPVNFMHLGLIATLFPNARIIHCRRDPLDTALSCFMRMFRLSRDFTTDLESIGQYYLQYERLMTHWRKVLPLPMYEQRYEDLVADPEKGSRALIAHCGLIWDEACLDSRSDDRAVTTPSRWQVRQPVYSSSVGRWRQYESQLDPLRRMLEQRGYRY